MSFKRLFILFFLFHFLSGCQKKNDSIKIYFAGDLLLDRGVREQINIHGVAHLFQKTRPVFQNADAVIANLECPITESSSPVNKKYIFRGEPTWLKEVKQSGITHLIMANNHSYDQGRKGMEETNKHIIENNLIPVGYGVNQDNACNPVLIEKGERKIALFASVLLPLENWTYLPDSLGMCQATIDDLVNRIKEFKIIHIDYKIIVSLHWGAEFHETPTIEQRVQAIKLVDAGADAIIGHHPHVIQKQSIYKSKPIFFSIGNFIFDQKTDAANKGLIVELNFSPDKDDFKIHPFTIKNSVPSPID